MKYLRNENIVHENLDDPSITNQRREIIFQKAFLKKIYLDWYRYQLKNLPKGRILEVGSGAGFLKDLAPHVITSDILACEGLDLIMDAHQLPFEESTLDGIVLTNVLHHLKNSREFFKEASRCVRNNGMIIMNEPWSTWWSQIIYKLFHHEPFNTESKSWSFPSSGPLSGANGALPWIIFKRDINTFRKEFPEWKIQAIVPHMPFSYLISG
ncbi:MAG: methyltransferase domain-containing protein, partial [Aliifodinibius sp.]|nr:class I SAM-dependent methyltransferase [Phycisphaerae bacterium]NIV10382.1 methyltransferase domain-containing protein [Fodinibius sp.]